MEIAEEQKNQLKEKIKTLFDDQKAQEFFSKVVLVWFADADDDGKIEVAHIAGEERADPDAAASAVNMAFALNGFAEIFNKCTRKSVCFEHTFFGDGLTGPENNIFKRECKIELFGLNQFNPERYKYVLVYEVSNKNGKIPKIDAAWDHHDRLIQSKDAFIDVRRDVPATSIIVINYVAPFFKKDDAVSGRLASALKYGIESDVKSSGGSEKTQEDTKLENKLEDFYDEEILNEIHKAKIVKEDYWFILAEHKVKTFGSFIVAGLGFLSTAEYLWKHANLVTQITDGIHTVLCFGIVDGKVFYKMRASKDSIIDLGELDEYLQGKKKGKMNEDEERSGTRTAADGSASGGGDLDLFPEPPSNLSSEDQDQYFGWVFEGVLKRIAPLLTKEKA